jgi:osomolarity two-component system, sensor histidine kinase NIK1
MVAHAICRGDLSYRITCTDCMQNPLLASINAMADKLTLFTTTIIHVAREVGVEGKLGVQASSERLDGVWKDFVGHLNLMASNHSEQVRDIAEVSTAVAHGDLSKKITVNVKGETLVLKNTINTMGMFRFQTHSISTSYTSLTEPIFSLLANSRSTQLIRV